MNYLTAMGKGYIPPYKPKYSDHELEFAKSILLKLEDKELLLAVKASQVYNYAADEDFWHRRCLQKGLGEKPMDTTWKNYYLKQFV